MNTAVEPIDGGKATLAELRRAGIDALAKALGPVGMARFLQQFDPGQGDYTAERGPILVTPCFRRCTDWSPASIRTGPTMTPSANTSAASTATATTLHEQKISR